MTSNVGVEHIRRENALGFRPGEPTENSEEKDYREMRTRLLGDLRKTFRPEFLNRVDEIIIFHSLTQPQLREIVDLMATELGHRMAEQGVGIELTTAAKDRILDLGWNPNYGARPLRRTLQREIENHIARMLLDGRCEVFVDVKEEEFTFETQQIVVPEVEEDVAAGVEDAVGPVIGAT